MVLLGAYTSAAVTLVFEHAHIGAKHEFTVTRSWDVKESGVNCSLEVLRDGDPLDEIDRENAEEFLRDLVPPGVAQLYFFDGEKIQELADAEGVDAALSDAIKNLLGLELVDRLQADLRIYKNRLDGESTKSQVLKTIETLDYELQAKRDEVIELRKAVDESTSQADSIRKDIARQELRIAKEGGAYANKREQLEVQRKAHLARITEIENEVRRHAESLLPFTLVPELCISLEAQVLAERQIQEWTAVEKVFEDRGSVLRETVSKLLHRHAQQLGSNAIGNIEAEVTEALAAFVARPKYLEETRVIHNLSSEQQSRVLLGIQRARNEIPEQMDALQKALERETRSLLRAEQALKKVPSEDQLRPMVEAINELNQRLGSAQTIVRQSEAALASAEFAIKELERKLDNAEQQQRESNKLHEKQELASRVQAVLEEYHDRLLQAKSTELAEALMARFSQLWRKGDRATRIEINPATYEVLLFDRHNRPVPKKELSAGEKQIFAIAILWALADVSGRPLPMVIDTPLGRLDGDHRNHLVERYFPHASHQVIILSTDTEIDEEYFNDLAPATSQAFHLRYSKEDARTIIEDKYFWKRRSTKKELAGAAQ